MNYEYYYNTVPEIGQVRNNLIYTSLISEDKKTFVQWYHNDTEYHQGKNEIIDPELMNDKWLRELKYLTLMYENYSDLVPAIKDIDIKEKKIYLDIDGVDFWQQHFDRQCRYEDILSDWSEQMLAILEAHNNLGFYKYSLHPSSYFVVDGRLKSINYFFCHSDNEAEMPLEHFRSHISRDRQEKLEVFMNHNGIDWSSVLPYKTLQTICLESFRSNYPDSFIDRAKLLYA